VPESAILECAALLSDLDGVHIDSTACIRRHRFGWAQLHGLDFQATVACAHGRRTVETMRQVAPFLDVEAEASRFAQHEAENNVGVSLIAGAPASLETFPSTNGQWSPREGEQWSPPECGASDCRSHGSSSLLRL
jgi:sugar-phosphatase